MKPETMGEAVERQGIPMTLSLLADIAGALQRIPIGEWDYQFASNSRWRLVMNGGKAQFWQGVQRFHVMLEYNGWPAAIISPAGGIVHGGVTEQEVIEVLETELKAVQS